METISNLRFKARRLLASSTLGTKILVAIKFTDDKYHRLLVNNKTDICIEGFPRCANSFAFNIFNQWNPGNQVGRHLHLPEQVRRSVKYQTPTIILIRNPGDAIASLSIGLPLVSLSELCKSYIQFYRVVIENIDKLVVSDFDDTTANFDLALRELNRRFDTSFIHKKIKDDTTESILENLRQHSVKTGWEKMTSAPVPGRETDKNIIKLELEKLSCYYDCKKLYCDIIQYYKTATKKEAVSLPVCISNP